MKLVTVAPANPRSGLPLIQGIYVLFERPSLSPIALFDASALTAIRTAAVSALATKHLARTDATRLVIFGAGVQAHSHLEAMTAVRHIDALTVVSPSGSEDLVARARTLGVEATSGDADAVATADIVCTCTTSVRPVFDGSLLRPGTHVNAIGSYTQDARELDDRALAQARIVVDTITALKESGDLTQPLESGLLAANAIETLRDVVTRGRGSSDNSGTTIFKSVGSAFEDLAVAQAASALL